MTQSGAALDNIAAHGVHVRLGKLAFNNGDIKQARRHLLSAAFGMPKDAECNFWLGEVYRKMDKPIRAWSRYFQAMLDPKVSAEVLAASMERLDEMNRDPAFRETFNMVIAEQYMAGRLEDFEFHAPSRHSLVKDEFPGRVKLVELFTNATDPANGGMQLAFQALDEYFEGDLALIEYHLNDPMHSEVAAGSPEILCEPTPAAGRFRWDCRCARGCPAGRKRWRKTRADISRHFAMRASSRKVAPESGWTLDAKMSQDGTKVSGTITAAGAGATDKLRLHAIVCERSVMAIEANNVFFHHFVARQALTPPDGLDLKNALAQPLEFTLDADEDE